MFRKPEIIAAVIAALAAILVAIIAKWPNDSDPRSSILEIITKTATSHKSGTDGVLSLDIDFGGRIEEISIDAGKGDGDGKLEQGKPYSQKFEVRYADVISTVKFKLKPRYDTDGWKPDWVLLKLDNSRAAYCFSYSDIGWLKEDQWETANLPPSSGMEPDIGLSTCVAR